MRPSTKPTRSNLAKGKLGLLFLAAFLPLLLVACASPPNRVTQVLLENHGNFLTPLASQPASEPEDKPDLLEVCALAPEEDLQEMRGTLGVYFFDYNFDINLATSPQVQVKTSFQAVLPDGSPAPAVTGATAVFRDNNVSFTVGPSNGGGFMSEVMVTGRDNIVFANTQFNIHIPNASTLIPNLNVMPAASLSGIGGK